MSKKINVDGDEYDLESFNQDAKVILKKLQQTNKKIQDNKKMCALLMRAKKSYMSELKQEIIKGKSGVDVASLFD
jgi:hypothetical protein